MERDIKYTEWLKPKGRNYNRQRKNAFKNDLIRSRHKQNISSMVKKKAIERLDGFRWIKAMRGYYKNPEHD